MELSTTSEQQTKDIATKLAPTLTGGTILCLHGDLGAGKTTFVKGLAMGLGITDTILSPTFTLMNIYQITTTPYSLLPTPLRTLVHIDTYRLKDEHELMGIGAMDYIGQPDIITVVEWPEKIAELLKNKKVINITFAHASESTRQIKIDSVISN